MSTTLERLLASGHPTTKMLNEAIVGGLTSGNAEMEKQSADTINDYTKRRAREDSFLVRVIPPQNLPSNEIDRVVESEDPVKVVDLEPDAPGAISLPFGALGIDRYIRVQRYRIMFDRVVTRTFTKDVIQLRTSHADVRQILSDNSVKDLLAEWDSKFVATLNALLLGQNVVVPETGQAQWVSIVGGITRDSIAEAMKVLPKASQRLQTATVLINTVSIWDFVKWGRDEVGGDLSQEWLENGFREMTLFGKVRFLITIKHSLVPTNTIFMFADPTYMGKLFVLEDVTLYMEHKAFLIKFFSYSCWGGGIGNIAACGRSDFV